MTNSIIKKAKEYLSLGNDLELVEIIVSSDVGTPRKKGAFMFVNEDGESFGTVGGGNIEYQATLYAKELLLKKLDGEKKYNLSQKETEDIGMVCGGECKMHFTYLKKSEKSIKKIDELEEKIKCKSVVYIFGGGHVSMELAKLINYVGMEYVIWDDRIDFANSERFKNAKKVICESFNDIIEKISVTNNDMVVIMTRGHASDYLVEKQILKVNPMYIGVIGSENKNKILREKLLLDGFDKKIVDRVCAPIGFNIAAETPEEIAVSIVSELILARSKLENRDKVNRENSLIKLYKGKIC